MMKQSGKGPRACTEWFTHSNIYSDEDDVKPSSVDAMEVESYDDRDNREDKLFRTVNGKQEKMGCSNGLPLFLATFKVSDSCNECKVDADDPSLITCQSNSCLHHFSHPCGLSLNNWYGHQQRASLSKPEKYEPITEISEESAITKTGYYCYYYSPENFVTEKNFPSLCANQKKKGYTIKLPNVKSKEGIRVLWYKCYEIRKENLCQVLDVVEDGVADNATCLVPNTMIGHHTASIRLGNRIKANKLEASDDDEAEYYCYPDVVGLNWQLHCFRMSALAQPPPLQDSFDQDTWYVCTLLYSIFLRIEDKDLADEVVSFQSIAEKENYQLTPSLYGFAQCIKKACELSDSEDNLHFLLSFAKELKILGNLERVPKERPQASHFNSELYSAAQLIRSYVTCATIEAAEILMDILVMLDSTDYSYVFVPNAVEAVSDFHEKISKNKAILGVESLVGLINHLRSSGKRRSGVVMVGLLVQLEKNPPPDGVEPRS